jgi:Protein of unknown function (DUF4231)
MDNSGNDIAERRKMAMERYAGLLHWYERARDRSRIFFYLFQTLVIVLSAITPILILTTDSKVLQALPPAIASVLAGLMGVYQFNEHWLRRSSAAEALKTECIKYETRAGKDYLETLSESQIIQNLVLRIESIQADAVSQWRRARELSLTPELKPEDGSTNSHGEMAAKTSS